MRYTHGLSIQNEGGSHFASPCERACDSSFLWTCRWGGCSEKLKHSEAMSVSVALWRLFSSLLSNEGDEQANGRSRLPRPFFGGKSINSQNAPAGQCAWSPVPAKSAGLLACPTQSGVLEAQEAWAVTRGGMAFLARPVGPPGCLRPGRKHFCIEATSRSGSKTVLFLSMK